MFTSASDGRDRHTWLVALLVLLTLLPSAFVIWFMNEAVQVQAESSRRSTLEGYRAQLRLVRSRVEARWDAHAAQLNGAGDPAQRFEQLMLGEQGDGAILIDEFGLIAYPDRSRVQSQFFSRFSTEAAALEQQVTAAEQMEPGPAREQQIAQIAAALNDYSRPLSAGRRVMLMERLRDVDRNVKLPTQAALQLSTEIAERGGLALAPGVFQQTSLRDVWAFTSADGMTVILYRTGRIEAMMHDLLHEVTPSGILFNTFAPDEKADMEAIAAGPALPGWQLSFFEPLETLPVDESRREAPAERLHRGGVVRPGGDDRDRVDHRQHLSPAAQDRAAQDRPRRRRVARAANAAGVDARAGGRPARGCPLR